MILIFSEARDPSTHRVLDWLIFYGIDFQVVNREDLIKDLRFKIGEHLEIDLKFYNKLVNFNQIKCVWYRRGVLVREFPQSLLEINSGVRKHIEKHLASEWSTLIEVIYEHFEKLPSLGSYASNKYCNKLKNLIYAKSVGLDIPESWVIDNKKSLLEILSKDSSVITKSIQGDLKAKSGFRSEFGTFGPTRLDESILEKMSDTFFPSLVQTEVKKLFEVRVFVAFQKIWSMAIFSQQDSQTALDYRNYNHKMPNRYVPYLLPEDIEMKLRDFLKITQYDTGSIDFIVTNEMKFIFLEINPVGQFGFVAENCNYTIHKEIAEHLIKLKTQHDK